MAYRDVVSILRDAVRSVEGASERSLRAPWGGRTSSSARRLRHRMEGQQPCPLCATEASVARHTIETLLEHISEEEVKAAYRESDGLCVPHLLQAAEHADSRKVFSRLVLLQAERYESIIGELDEFIRKNDYRFGDEPMGEEGTAWLRAIALLVGEEPKRED